MGGRNKLHYNTHIFLQIQIWLRGGSGEGGEGEGSLGLVVRLPAVRTCVESLKLKSGHYFRAIDTSRPRVGNMELMW